MIPKENIYHRDLGISIQDVNNEDDIEVLCEWVNTVKDDIQEMNTSKFKALTDAEHLAQVINPEWFVALKTKKRFYGILHEEIAKRIQHLKYQPKYQEQKNAYQEKFERLFVDIAKEVLDNDVFDDIKAKALLMRDELENNTGRTVSGYL